MFLDAKTLENDSRLVADFCIVGAGIGGTSIALELDRLGKKIILVESGSDGLDPKTQDLYNGGVTGDSGHPALRDSRFRYLGGSCNKWGAYCIPFDETDFSAKRSGLPVGRWPFSYQSLTPYFKKACEFLQIGDFNFANTTNTPVVPGLERSKTLTTRYIKLSPLHEYGPFIKPKLSAAKNITSLVNANVTDLQFGDQGDKVESLTVKTLNGKTHTIAAKNTVICMGGLETIRLLLNCKLKNPDILASEMIGKNYSSHYDVRHGTAIFKKDVLPKFETEPFEGYALMRRLSLTHETKMKMSLFNSTFEFQEIPAAEVLNQFPYYADAVPRAFSLISITEEPQDGNSFVELNGENDELGMKKIKLHHYLKPAMWDSLNTSLKVIAKEFGQLDLGRIHFDPTRRLSKDVIDHFRYHHMGGTNMTSNPKEGVVDTDSRVHGIKNLYINSSSVFPTGGYANPVLTQLALAFRLAEYLGNQVRA